MPNHASQASVTDQPVMPSDRVTEAELLALESEVGQLLVSKLPSLALIAKLVAEIRRYRAMLLGLHYQLSGACCPGCDDALPSHNRGDCAWQDVEAEVEAIRAER